MRRSVSLLLLSLFMLGPVAAAMGDNDASLPACCRRNGAHHCSMARQRAAILASGKPIVTAPSTCPSYPGDNTLTTAPLHGLAPVPAYSFAFRTTLHTPKAVRTAALISAVNTRSSRAPPALA